MDKYEKGEEIASGSFGTIVRVVRKSDQTEWAMKMIELGDDRNPDIVTDAMLREGYIMRGINHPNILRVKETFVYGGHFCLVMEFYPVTLRDRFYHHYRGHYPEIIRRFLGQILNGLAHCHSLDIIHRDIKMENLLVDVKKKVVKIIDFGLSRGFTKASGELSPQVGTFTYMAPEMCLGSVHYTDAVDIWSVGCIFGELVLGKELFHASSDIQALEEIFRKLGAPNEVKWPGVSSLPRWVPRYEDLPLNPDEEFSSLFSQLSTSGFDLLQALLTLDPSKRISASDALNHPYLEGWDREDEEPWD